MFCWYHLYHIARPEITDIAQRYVERTSSSAEDGKAEGDISDALSSWEGSCTRRMVMIIDKNQVHIKISMTCVHKMIWCTHLFD